jgi:hypothetical protein
MAVAAGRRMVAVEVVVADILPAVEAITAVSVS